YCDFGGRNSFVENSRADIWGIKLGLSFHRRVRIGAGYNYMSSDLTKPLSYTDASGASRLILEHLKMRYASVYFEYVYFRNKHWEFSIPLQLGAGTSKYAYTIGSQSFEHDRQFILVYEPMVQTKYYIFPWLGAEVDVGIRLMAKGNSEIGLNLNSPMYAFGLFIAWDELYKSLFPHTALARKL
ncbi:MAG TPA: hypothetical protein VNZ86_14775, partial [Bacteroidia bacterium]|nr:hypothetical protein [Bacteroidia bacterium]